MIAIGCDHEGCRARAVVRAEDAAIRHDEGVRAVLQVPLPSGWSFLWSTHGDDSPATGPRCPEHS